MSIVKKAAGLKLSAFRLKALLVEKAVKVQFGKSHPRTGLSKEANILMSGLKEIHDFLPLFVFYMKKSNIFCLHFQI